MKSVSFSLWSCPISFYGDPVLRNRRIHCGLKHFFSSIDCTIMYVKTDWEEKLQQLFKNKMDRKSTAVGVH